MGRYGKHQSLQEAMTIQTLIDISNAVEKSILTSQASYDKQAGKTIQALNDISHVIKEWKGSRYFAVNLKVCRNHALT